MKIYAISDLHLSETTDKPMNIFGPRWEGHFDIIRNDWNSKVTDEDIVLLSGDLSWAMKLEEAIPDIALINELPGRKVIIKGNHDYWWSSGSKVRGILYPNMFAISNDAIRIDNVILCGTRGWLINDNNSTPSDKKIYDREIIRLKLSLDAMAKIRREDDIVIGMMHFPPFNSSLQNTELTDLFNEYNITKVVYGHLHGPKSRAEKLVNKGNVNYYLTSCDLVDNKLILINN